MEAYIEQCSDVKFEGNHYNRFRKSINTIDLLNEIDILSIYNKLRYPPE